MTSNPKKILLISQYFYPEIFRGNDIAFHLAEEGHEVHVVTGTPNYPTGKFFPGYGISKKRHEIINGVYVTRLPIVPRGVNNKTMLMMNFFSYYIVAWIYILLRVSLCGLGHLIGLKGNFNYDMVFCQQLSPVMISSPAILYKRLRHVPLYTWVLDLWPENLMVVGSIGNRYILEFFKSFTANEYKWSDKILTSSRSFSKSILEYGDYKDKIIYYPQWSDWETSSKPSPDGELPTIPQGFIVMYTGAVGDAQGMECNMQAALLTKQHKEIKWVIVGDGRRLDWVRQFVKENGLEDTVLILGHYPSETMSLFFEKADVMLASLADSPLFNLYAPAKISSYMASGRPIIACMNGEGNDIVKVAKCGWGVKANDAEGLARLVIDLSKTDKTILEDKGKAGRAYYDEHFNKEKCLKNLDKIMGLA